MRPEELRQRLREEAQGVRPSSDGLDVIRERIRLRRPMRRVAQSVSLAAASVIVIGMVVGAAVLADRARQRPVEIGPVADASASAKATDEDQFDPAPHLRPMVADRAWEDRGHYRVEPDLCGWAADVADQSAHARVRADTAAQERRSAVHTAVNSEGDYNGDGLYAAVAWSCIALRCPATPDNHVGGGGWMDGEDWEDPSAHADLGSDAAWPCATDDYV